MGINLHLEMENSLFWFFSPYFDNRRKVAVHSPGQQVAVLVTIAKKKKKEEAEEFNIFGILRTKTR